MFSLLRGMFHVEDDDLLSVSIECVVNEIGIFANDELTNSRGPARPANFGKKIRFCKLA